MSEWFPCAACRGHTDLMARWREYQEEAAALFRSLGLEAATDERLDGVRGTHEVDVVVRSRRAGLEQLWVVECKWRRRRVEKLHVAALAEIVRDVGADRGVMLSEVGFQAGAVRMAYKSNVSLTSLEELREAAADELLILRLGESRLRLAAPKSATERDWPRAASRQHHSLRVIPEGAGGLGCHQAPRGCRHR